jgi:hypothetical protein
LSKTIAFEGCVPGTAGRAFGAQVPEQFLLQHAARLNIKPSTDGRYRSGEHQHLLETTVRVDIFLLTYMALK